MTSNAPLHVVVGAGPTGTLTAHHLVRRGARVRVVTRSGSGPDHPSIERVVADAADAQRLAELAEGAVALYNCANPPYHRWPTDWPPVAESLITAAERTGAVLVTLSNLYQQAADSSPMRATDPLDPPSRKGEVRAAMYTNALAAHEAGRIRMVEVRASDFVGPGLGQNGHLGDRTVPRLLAGKSVWLVGDPDQPHSWTSVDDVAATLVAAAHDERAWGRAWMAPTAPPRTGREAVHDLCRAAGVDPVKVRAIPRTAVRLAGLFDAQLREMDEIWYQFTAPFVVDDADTRETLGLEPTPWSRTLTWAIEGYRAEAAGRVALLPVAA